MTYNLFTNKNSTNYVKFYHEKIILINSNIPIGKLLLRQIGRKMKISGKRYLNTNSQC